MEWALGEDPGCRAGVERTGEVGTAGWGAGRSFGTQESRALGAGGPALWPLLKETGTAGRLWFQFP